MNSQELTVPTINSISVKNAAILLINAVKRAAESGKIYTLEECHSLYIAAVKLQAYITEQDKGKDEVQ